MQYKNLIAGLVMGLAMTSQVAARGGRHGGFGQFGGKGANKGAAGNGQGAAAASGTTAAVAADATATSAAGAAGGNADLQLNPSAVQTGSQADGLQESGVASGDAASSTDPANFINFCAGKTLTNGLQVVGGSCNGIVMGDIPAKTKMVSTIITNPAPGAVIQANQDFNLSCNIQNIQAGSFTNADETYYAAPQQLNGGVIVGHTHFTVQDMNNQIAPTTALDASTFAFFKGVDTAADAQGNLAIPVAGGLPAGTYRVCTMSSASNHQPVLMPVAQRGAQDDCTKFTVSDNGAAGSSSAVSSAAASQSTGNAAAAGAAGAAGGSGQQGGNGNKNSNKGADKGGKASGQDSGNNNGGSNSGKNNGDNKGSKTGDKGFNSNKGSSTSSGSGKSQSSPDCKNSKKNKNKVRSWNA